MLPRVSLTSAKTLCRAQYSTTTGYIAAAAFSNGGCIVNRRPFTFIVNSKHPARSLPMSLSFWVRGISSSGKLCSVERFQDVHERKQIFIVQPMFRRKAKGPNVRRDVQFELDEAYGLVDAVSGWRAFGSEVVKLNDPNPKSFIGKGRLADVKTRICAFTGGGKKNGDVIAFFNCVYLTAMQTEFLSNFLECTVFDRYSLILAIFYSRARTREAMIQIELAELKYMKSRLKYLMQIRDGGRVTGAEEAGLVGESRVEMEKRKLSKKEVKLRRELENIEANKKMRRGHRTKTGVPVIGIVGYTNVGKTALVERLRSFGGRTNDELTGGDNEFVIGGQDKLFATLDSRASSAKLPSGLRVVFMDTIGFISNLPHSLVSAFRSTLDEVLEADVIVHVRDCSHTEQFEQFLDVHAVMSQLYERKDPEKGIVRTVHGFVLHQDEKEKQDMHPWLRHIEVVNKIDKLSRDELLHVNEPPRNPEGGLKEVASEKDLSMPELEEEKTDQMPLDMDIVENADSRNEEWHGWEEDWDVESGMQANFRRQNFNFRDRFAVEPVASVYTSVLTGEGLEELMTVIEMQVMECTNRTKAEVTVDCSHHECISWLYGNCNVVSENLIEGVGSNTSKWTESLKLEVVMEKSALKKFKHMYGDLCDLKTPSAKEKQK
eukprot:Nk52_evm6s279 gene=Nk52_evmTU6s279